MLVHHAARQLHRDLRVRLIVLHDEADLAAADAAVRVGDLLDGVERLLFLLPEKRRAAR